MSDMAPESAVEIVKGVRRHQIEMVALYHLSQSYHHTLNPLLAPVLPDAEIQSFIKAYLQRSPLRLRRTTKAALVAQAEGKVVGYILYALFRNRDITYTHRGMVCQVEDIVVDPRARKRNLATRLCDEIVAIAERNKPCLMRATVWKGNDACIRLLENFEAPDVAHQHTRLVD